MSDKHDDCISEMEVALSLVQHLLIQGCRLPVAIAKAAAQYPDPLVVSQMIMESLLDALPARARKAEPSMLALLTWDIADRRTQADRIDLVMKSIRTAREAHKQLRQGVEDAVQRCMDIANGKVKPGDPCTDSSKSSSQASRR
jgi:hypothetical protein